MLAWKIRLFFQQLFWTKKEKEFYNIFHTPAWMQRAARKEGYLDLDAMVRMWKERQKERMYYDRMWRDDFKGIFEKISRSGGDAKE